MLHMGKSKNVWVGKTQVKAQVGSHLMPFSNNMLITVKSARYEQQNTVQYFWLDETWYIISTLLSLITKQEDDNVKSRRQAKADTVRLGYAGTLTLSVPYKEVSLAAVKGKTCKQIPESFKFNTKALFPVECVCSSQNYVYQNM